MLEESLAVLEDQLPDYFLGAGQLYRDQQGQVRLQFSGNLWAIQGSPP